MILGQQINCCRLFVVTCRLQIVRGWLGALTDGNEYGATSLSPEWWPQCFDEIDDLVGVGRLALAKRFEHLRINDDGLAQFSRPA